MPNAKTKTYSSGTTRPNVRLHTSVVYVWAVLASVMLPHTAHGQFTNADLALAAHPVEPVYAGIPSTLTVIVTNRGPDYVTGVSVQNQFPVGTTIMSSAVSHSDGREFPGDCVVGTGGSPGSRVSCSVGSIAHQGSATITIVYAAREGRHSIQSWTFAGLNIDSNLVNNTVEVSIDVTTGAVPAVSPLFLALLIVVIGLISWARL